MSSHLRFVIIYDDLAAGHRAGLAAALIGRGLAGEMTRQRSFWRLDLLDHPFWCDQMLADATRADIILLSTSDPDGLPPLMARWCDACRELHPAAGSLMFVLVGARDNGPVATREEQDVITLYPRHLIADAPGKSPGGFRTEP
jgi:hypothetical protein